MKESENVDSQTLPSEAPDLSVWGSIWSRVPTMAALGFPWFSTSLIAFYIFKATLSLVFELLRDSTFWINKNPKENERKNQECGERKNKKMESIVFGMWKKQNFKRSVTSVVKYEKSWKVPNGRMIKMP